MKYRVTGELYGAALTATKVRNQLAGYSFLDIDTIEDAVDEKGAAYVLVDLVLAVDGNKAAIKTKLQNAVSAYGITGRLSFHECTHGSYESDAVTKPCVNEE